MQDKQSAPKNQVAEHPEPELEYEVRDFGRVHRYTYNGRAYDVRPASIGGPAFEAEMWHKFVLERLMKDE